MVAWDAVAKVAGEQAGAVSRRQLRALGAYPLWVTRRLAEGALLDLGADVFAVAGSPDTAERRRWAALLAAGDAAHLSHEAGAELHGTRGIRRGLVVVTAAHPLHLRIPGATLHQLDDVAPHHLTTVRGMPVTTPARTIVDLAAVVSPMRLSTALEHTVVERQATLSEVVAVLREVRRRGKPGVANLVATLAALDGQPIPASELERLLLAAARLAGVAVVGQHALPWAHEPIEGLVDAAVPSSRLVLEADGRPWHARLDAMAKDRRRDVEAARAGWLTLRFVAEDLRDIRSTATAIADVHRSRV